MQLVFPYAVNHAVWWKSRDPDIPGALGGGPAPSPVRAYYGWANPDFFFFL